MKLLALDASTEFLSLAVRDCEQLYTYDEHAGQAASQLILPQIQRLLDQAKLTLTDLDGIAFGAGPGSFTGVRVACGVAQGLAFGANLPVERRNSEGKDSDWHALHAAGVYKPDAVPSIDGTGWVGAGTAWGVYDEVLSQQYADQVVSKHPAMTPAAAAIMALALPVFEAGEAKPAEQARPVYIRNRVALTSKEREQGLRL